MDAVMLPYVGVPINRHKITTCNCATRLQDGPIGPVSLISPQVSFPWH